MKEGPGQMQTDELVSWARSLRQEIDGHRHDIDELSAKLAHAEERLNLVNRLLELDGRSSTTRSPEDSELSVLYAAEDVEEPPRVATAMRQESSLEDAVARILDDAGEPQHISKIREQLIDAGVPIPGRGEDANIIIRITAQERFCRVARGTYALASWGIPAMTPKKGRPRKRKASKK